MVVDILSASKEELKAIKGIGDKTADKIIALRDEDNLNWTTLLQAASSLSAAYFVELMDRGDVSFIPFPADFGESDDLEEWQQNLEGKLTSLGARCELIEGQQSTGFDNVEGKLATLGARCELIEEQQVKGFELLDDKLHRALAQGTRQEAQMKDLNQRQDDLKVKVDQLGTGMAGLQDTMTQVLQQLGTRPTEAEPRRATPVREPPVEEVKQEPKRFVFADFVRRMERSMPVKNVKQEPEGVIVDDIGDMTKKGGKYEQPGIGGAKGRSRVPEQSKEQSLKYQDYSEDHDLQGAADGKSKHSRSALTLEGIEEIN